MKTKLWQTSDSGKLHPAVEAYTVGNDYQLDQKLLDYDIVASKAHASMLQNIAVLTPQEHKQVVRALSALHRQWLAGTFVVTKDQEDGHTAIEHYLVDKLGDIGKKIHTGRSRNDQALVMMRLYLMDSLTKVATALDKAAKTYKTAAQKAGATPMPGYTHQQKAMPTTVAMWLGSYADGLTDVSQLVASTKQLIDQNPLGSAAGFGSDLPLNREHTTKVLGFAKTQANPMYCGLSRGLFELMAVQSLNPAMVLASKFATDMLLFTTQEFDLLSLPNSFTTGSSIMPHKHNYDLFEIMRGKAHSFSAHAQQLQALASGAGSGYHRDLQLTKQLTLQAFTTVLETLDVLNQAVPHLVLHKQRLTAAITPEMQSVARINQLVSKGLAFRDAYAKVKAHLAKVE